MLRAITVSLLLLTVAVAAERREPASPSELAAITKRGRLLAEYDEAAWRASDAVMALKPDRANLGRYICMKTESGWTVAFGRLTDDKDKFLVAYEAVRTERSPEFQVTKHDSPKPDVGFLLHAARALELAAAEFTGESRPYNGAVLPSESGDLYVYIVPAQTQQGVFPLGADARYRVSADGLRIIEKRQMHVSIIEFAPKPDVRTEGGVHTAFLDDVPEDSDVFHVLARRPSVPEWVATKHFVYSIAPDGNIKYLMTTEALERTKPK